MKTIKVYTFFTATCLSGYQQGTDFESWNDGYRIGIKGIVLFRTKFPEDDDRVNKEIFIPLDKITEVYIIDTKVQK